MLKTAPINMRVDPNLHALLTKAATILHKDRSAFILDVARKEAENILLNQRFFQLDKETFEAFDAALTAPLPQNAKLKALLKEKPPWEQ